jgi:hypothetical protein
MSYARWSNSQWYAFYNVNGCLSLWYDMEHTYDIPYEDAKDLTAESIKFAYGCTEEEAKEAMEYVALYLEDYDPSVEEEYEKELNELITKFKENGDE